MINALPIGNYANSPETGFGSPKGASWAFGGRKGIYRRLPLTNAKRLTEGLNTSYGWARQEGAVSSYPSSFRFWASSPIGIAREILPPFVCAEIRPQASAGLFNQVRNAPRFDSRGVISASDRK